ncbi:MAG: lipoyl synthase [candidate division NC10 bacterium]|nr:lipoyl synthase [candidate division NC10 bacterium]
MRELPLLNPTPPRWRTARAPAVPGPIRKPDWLKVRAPGGPNYMHLKGLLRTLRLHTVCEEAHCPNIGECFEDLTATFMILGDTCTRQCAFCAVTHGRPTELDLEEPVRVAEAVKTLELKHAVVTSVNRDELADGGAGIFAATIREIRQAVPDCTVEVLIPDFRGNWDALAAVMAERPEILNHNMETVPRLYREVRPGAQYGRSLELLRRAKAMAPEGLTKSGVILGFGETQEELLSAMADLRAAGCDILTLGQYLRPSTRHVPIAKFYRPEEFDALRREGEALGFRWVEAGPLVRSSYHARGQTRLLEAPR